MKAANPSCKIHPRSALPLPSPQLFFFSKNVSGTSKENTCEKSITSQIGSWHWIGLREA
uniref:Uncharacterized protein n=1 Tax=Athene cunicularia TaxID=194338 RepID=A0A663M8R1_ATHCN